MTVRVLYHHEPEGWWAESPDIDGWSVTAESYEEVRRLAEDGVSFALASAAEDRGESFDEEQLAAQLVAMSQIAWKKHARLQWSVGFLIAGAGCLLVAVVTS